MDDSLSISISVSKNHDQEDLSISRAAIQEAVSQKQRALSNEQIRQGDLLLDTYAVRSDAISGGMGSVWKVHHKNWKTDLAMKRPQPRFFTEGSEDRKEQFITECENWIGLGLHPNIVSCYYVREIGGVPTIFSEWMDGGSLKDRIRDKSLYEGTEKEVRERILDIAIQAARGLHYAHENGLIHQDMKPGNLLLTKEWDAKIGDFGLAKAKADLEDGSDVAMTAGYTLAYCPAEQADGEEAAAWMDVYAWALTVLEMYEGERKWDTGAQVRENAAMYCGGIKADTAVKVLLQKCIVSTPDDFTEIIPALEEAYRISAGKKYPRSASKAAADSADSLNNKALSFLDLQQSERALQLLEQASALDHNNGNVFLNHLLCLWRSGRKTDREAFRLLEDSGSLLLGEDAYYLALAGMYCENGQLKEALEVADQHEGETSDWEQIVSYLMDSPTDYNITLVRRYPHKKTDGLILAPKRSEDLVLINENLPGRYRRITIPARVHSSDDCTFSYDGQNLVTVSREQGIVQIWNTGNGKPVRREVCRLRGRFGVHKYIEYTPDNRYLIVVDEMSVRVFSAKNRYNQEYLLEPDMVPFSADLSVRKNLLVVGFDNGILRSYRLTDGELLREYRLDTGRIYELNLRLNDAYAECSIEYKSRVLSTNLARYVHLESGQCIYCPNEKEYRVPLQLSIIRSTAQQSEQAGLLEMLLTKAENAIAEAKPLEAAAALDEARLLPGMQNAMRICRINEQLAGFGTVSGIRGIWQEGSAFEVEGTDDVRVLAADSRGRVYKMVSKMFSKTFSLKMFEQGKEPITLADQEKLYGDVSRIAFSPDGKMAYLLDSSGEMYALDPDRKKLRELFDFPNIKVFDLSADGKLLAVDDREVVGVHDLSNRKQKPALFARKPGKCYGLWFTQGKSEILIFLNKTILIWNYRKNKVVCEYEKEYNLYALPVISPDGCVFAIETSDYYCELCDTYTGKTRIRFALGEHEKTASVRFTFIRNGSCLVTQVYKKPAVIWNAQTGEKLYTFTGGEMQASDFIFAQDGQRIFAVHSGNRISQWYADYIYRV